MEIAIWQAFDRVFHIFKDDDDELDPENKP